MKYIFKNITLSIAFAVAPVGAALAAPGTGAGSTNVLQNTHVAFGTTVSIYSESLYIGPGNNIIDGTVEVFSSKVWIAPNANITGPGTIILRSPADNPFWEDMPASATRIDHNNGAAIEVNLRLLNPDNLLLGDITDPGFGTANPAAPFAAALHLGNDLNLAIDHGDVLLNGNDLILSPFATISNYGQARMVVTGNSIAGHLVREAATGTFTYPVGIAEGDYTPASITLNTPQTMHVGITDYSATAATIEAPQEGMNRTWHLYSNSNTTATISLQHNAITNGSAYTDNLAFITQYQGGNTWSSQPANGYLSAGLHTLSNVTIPVTGDASGSWLTKTSDAITPLPVRLISFDGLEKGCKALLIWQSAEEHNFSRYEVERSSDGIGFNKIGMVQATGSNSSYTYTDLNPSKGNNIYRLRLIDIDGTATYSDYVTVQINCSNTKLLVYPNPTSDQVNISGLEGNERLILYDALGRSVYSAAVTGSTAVINLNRLANATYNLVVVTPLGNSKTFKIVKKD